MASVASAGEAGLARKRKRDGQGQPHDAWEPQQIHPDPAAVVPQSDRGPSPAASLDNRPKKQRRSPADDLSQSSRQPSPEGDDAPRALPRRQEKKQKLPTLPKSATVSKRPLHRPAVPHPHTSSSSPKVLYVKHSTPFVPTVKRIRSLLRNISDRAQQSHNTVATNSRRELRATGHLGPKDIEREIAEANHTKQSEGRENLYLKATGRAISRALEIAVFFQGEVGCHVNVELGSVRAIDDIEVHPLPDGGIEEGGGEPMDVDTADGEHRARVKDRADPVEHVPETRVRTLSSVTVAIGLR